MPLEGGGGNLTIFHNSNFEIERVNVFTPDGGEGVDKNIIIHLLHGSIKVAKNIIMHLLHGSIKVAKKQTMHLLHGSIKVAIKTKQKHFKKIREI